MRNAPVLLSTLLALAAALPAAAADLAVTLRDARSQAGTFQVALVDAAGYAGAAKPVAARLLAPAGDSTAIAFDGVAPGRYAVMVIHDENGNGKLDTNFVGMPVEGYGFSNNPRVMRKPTFDEAAFDLGAGGASIDVAIR